MKALDGSYKPEDFEKEIYDFWSRNNFFHGRIDYSKKPFSIVIPPPNITGHLHVGHALNNTLQDIVIRYARMKGYSACWIPGTDHAGIATQNVVERKLNEGGTTRFELGRKRFVEEVWQWRNQYGSRIIEQLKALGCSCDWDRLRFTLDDGYVRAVNREFVTLFDAGLIYRGNYMVNWCPRCLTAISDIEVEHRARKGFLWEIKYPLIDKTTGEPSRDEFLLVATTRPETMLGDTAVAINPLDKRYKKYKGREVLLPLMDRFIPVIEDSYVDMKFGTGAVKVTPAHDPNDFEIGRRHGLDKVDVMDDSAVMNENAGKYCGLDRYKAREEVLKDLEALGYLVSKKTHMASIGNCSRCETIIEPRISNQWFVAMESLAKPAIKAVREGRIKFIPRKWERLYFNWMENIRDWCISRQLWWGHRIPVWYCEDCDEMIVSESAPPGCKCGSSRLRQDDDVLDTWFSSCLWPFASLGWPDKTEDLKYYFPTSVLITAHDIIFFWVARMIMMSKYFMDDIPFGEVFINPLVNDARGQKMSKSKGNVIDPMEIIDKSGSDVLRFTLASLTTPGRNLLLGDEKIEGSRNFANKLWNAAKFVVSGIDDCDLLDDPEILKNIDTSSMNMKIWDRWILSRLTRTIKSLEKYIEKYQISFACRTLTGFFWNDYCDWYLEASKLRLYKKKTEKTDNNYIDDRLTVLYILWYVLERFLKLLHPFMPFLTEKVWLNIPHDGESIMVSDFPDTQNIDFARVEDDIEKESGVLFEVIGEIRRIRSELRINPGVKIKVNIRPSSNDVKNLLEANSEYIMGLAKLEYLTLKEPPEKKGFIKTVKSDSVIYINLIDAIDIDLEIKRIRDEISKEKLKKEKSSRKISNPQFLKKAPAEIINKEKNKLEQTDKSIKNLHEQLDLIRNLKT